MLLIKETSTTLTNELELLQKAAREKAEQDFGQPSLHKELVNRLSLKYLATDENDAGYQAWLQHNYPLAVEALFTEIYNHCFFYAKKLIKSPDKAEDIAQECIRELLGCPTQIRNLKAWLARVVHNIAVAHFHNLKRDTKLLNELETLQEIPPDPDEDDLHARIGREKVRQLLSQRDFSQYQKIFAAKSLKDYAMAQGITYNTAKEHKHRFKVNLRSAYLKEQGWKDSPEILSFQQLRCIKRFINRLMDNCGKLCHYQNQSLQEAMKDCTGLLTWDISMLDENCFHLILLFKTLKLPSLVTVDIKLNRANRITITSCKPGTLIATLPVGDAEPLSREKGRAQLNYSELLKMVPQATVYDPVRFQGMLKELQGK